MPITDQDGFVLRTAKKGRMYWASGKRLVLLPPKGGQGNATLFEVSHPDQFVQELREWSNPSWVGTNEPVFITSRRSLWRCD